MTVTTSSGITCSPDRATADKARPTTTQAHVVRAMSTTSSTLPEGITLPAPGLPLPIRTTRTSTNDCTIAAAQNTTIFAVRYAEGASPAARSRW